MCICVKKSSQGDRKLMVSVTLTLTKKMRSECGGHEISIGNISGTSQLKVKMFSVMRSASTWPEGIGAKLLTLIG